MNKKPVKYMLYFLIIALPSILSFLLVKTCLHTDLMNFHPYWTDEVDYWTQINSFHSVGFNTGYFTINELTSKSEFSHYGTHGPVFPILYGTLTYFFNWQDYSGPFVNLILISVALLFFVLIVRPNIKQSIILIALLMFFYQIYLTIPSMMQESLHFSFAIILSAMLIRLFIFRDNRFVLKIAIVLIIIFSSLFRIIWVCLLFPVFFTFFNHSKITLKRTILAIALSLLICILISLLYVYWTSPYPNGSFYNIMQPGNSIKQIASMIMTVVSSNVQKLITKSTAILETEYRFRYIYFLSIFILFFFVKRSPVFIGSLLFMLTSTLVLTIFIYDIGNFRVIIPFLLIALITIIFLGNKTLILITLSVYLLITLITIPQFYKDYQRFLSMRFEEVRDVADPQIGIELGKLDYLEGADPWCNSILSTRAYTRDFLYLTPGIGTNIILNTTSLDSLIETGFSVKSHYLLVPPDYIEGFGLKEKCVVIKEFDEDILCERIDDGCR